MVYGAKFNLLAIVLQRQFQRASKLWNMGLNGGANKPWTALGNLRRAMKAYDSQETIPWTWLVAGVSVSVNRLVGQLEEALHQFRTGGREFQFKAFFNRSRREAKNLLELFADERLLVYFRKIDL